MGIWDNIKNLFKGKPKTETKTVGKTVPKTLTESTALSGLTQNLNNKSLDKLTKSKIQGLNAKTYEYVDKNKKKFFVKEYSKKCLKNLLYSSILMT